MEQQHVVTDHPPVSAGGFFRSLEHCDQFNRLAAQARGIAYLLGHSSHIKDVVPERVSSAAWALQDLIDGMVALANQREAGHE